MGVSSTDKRILFTIGGRFRSNTEKLWIITDFFILVVIDFEIICAIFLVKEVWNVDFLIILKSLGLVKLLESNWPFNRELIRVALFVRKSQLETHKEWGCHVVYLGDAELFDFSELDFVFIEPFDRRKRINLSFLEGLADPVSTILVQIALFFVLFINVVTATSIFETLNFFRLKKLTLAVNSSEERATDAHSVLARILVMVQRLVVVNMWISISFAHALSVFKGRSLFVLASTFSGRLENLIYSVTCFL